MTYRPPFFRVDDRAALLDAIAGAPLATLVTLDGGELYVTNLPMMAATDGGATLLQGHVARANAHWRHGSATAVAVFRIAGHYVSPNWYPSRHVDPQTVPTFDYVAVEARGPVRFIEDPAWLNAFLRRFTDDREARVGENWSVDDAPAAYIASQVAAVVGVEMRVEQLLGTYKLHQNHPPENVASVYCALERLNTPAALALSEQLRPTMP